MRTVLSKVLLIALGAMLVIQAGPAEARRHKPKNRTLQANPAPSRSEIEDLVAWARAAEKDFDYERALELWNSVIAHPASKREQRVLASAHAGMIERVRGNTLQAREHFVYVLDRQPDYQLPAGTAPKIRDFFELVRRDMPPPVPPAQVPDPVPATTEAEGGGAGTWLVVGVAGMFGGALVAALGALPWQLAGLEQQQALSSQVQLDRVAHYDQRDLYANLAGGAWVGGAVIGLAGAGALLIALLSGPGEES